MTRPLDRRGGGGVAGEEVNVSEFGRVTHLGDINYAGVNDIAVGILDNLCTVIAAYRWAIRDSSWTALSVPYPGEEGR